LLPTGGLSKPRFSSIHRRKLKGGMAGMGPL
jgi:hypothetical protein